VTYSAIIEPVLRGDVKGDRPTDISRAFREVAGLMDRNPTEAQIRVQADSGSVGRFFVQVVDRRSRAAVGPYAVRLWLTTDDTGLVPGGSQTVAFVVGSIIDTVAANERYVVLTDAQGRIELTATVGATQTVRLVATVEPFLHVSDAFAGNAVTIGSNQWDWTDADNSAHAMLMWD
jgi:hypothetical protein